MCNFCCKKVKKTQNIGPKEKTNRGSWPKKGNKPYTRDPKTPGHMKKRKQRVTHMNPKTIKYQRTMKFYLICGIATYDHDMGHVLRDDQVHVGQLNSAWAGDQTNDLLCGTMQPLPLHNVVALKNNLISMRTEQPHYPKKNKSDRKIRRRW